MNASIKKISLGLIFVFLSSLAYLLLPDSCPEPARRMAVIFIFAALCWATEIIPLYAASILVVLLEVLLLSRPPVDLPHESFLKPFANPVIFLFFGGFVLSRAFQKWGLDLRLASFFMHSSQGSPHRLLLGLMAATAFLSMWLSNTATAALMFALAHPLFERLDAKDPFRKALAMGIAFAAVYGGIATPIGTPPNALALAMLAKQGIEITFLQWMFAALPFAVLLVLLSSFLLLIFFPARGKQLIFPIAEIKPLTPQQKWVLAIGASTVFLWLTGAWHGIPESICALFAAGALAASGLIQTEDIRKIEWDILILMWGGLALGSGMEASGLASWLVQLPIFTHSGISLILVFCVLTVLLSTFISNTAAVNLLLPLAMSFSGLELLPLALVITVSSSLDFPLPVSTPPMAIAYGTGYLRVADMIKIGSVLTLLANAVLVAAVYFIL